MDGAATAARWVQGVRSMADVVVRRAQQEDRTAAVVLVVDMGLNVY